MFNHPTSGKSYIAEVSALDVALDIRLGIFRRAGVTPAATCIRCGQRTLATELVRCHDLSGVYHCNPHADYAAQAVATIAATLPITGT